MSLAPALQHTAAGHPSEAVAAMRFNELKGLNVLFINMPLRESATPNTPPQGPGLLAARARQYGAQVSIVDLNAYRIKDSMQGKPNGRWLSYEEAENLLQRHMGVHGEPDIIGFSGMITTLRWQEWSARTCRALVPNAFIVSGGGLATEIREGLFSWVPDLDAVVHSEGDDIFLVLAKDVLASRKRGHSMFHAPYCLGEQGGKLRFLYGGDRVQDLDVLPFAAWDLLHEDIDSNPILERYLQVPVWGSAANNSSATSFKMERSLTAVSSRGCPYSCAFCYRGAQGERLYRMRGVSNLIEEVTSMRNIYQLDFFGFNDDNFAVDRRRIQMLPEVFKPLGGFRWGTHTRLDEAADERAQWMAEAGCIYIGFGAESASPRVLDRMDKGGFILRPRGGRDELTRIGDFEFPTTMITGIRNCRDVGIHANCTWIMGYPGEKLYDLQTSVAFMLWQEELLTQGLTPGSDAYVLARASVNKCMFTATAYPGTAMFREPQVQTLLTENFGLSFEHGEPVPNEALRQYTLELDDATKVMYNSSGRPLYYGDMTEEQFLQARTFVDSGCTEKILDM